MTDGPRRSWAPLRWGLLGLVAAGVVLLFWARAGDEAGGTKKGKRRDARPTPVSIAAVTRGDLVELATYPGELDADAVDVAAEIAGRVQHVHVRLGDAVTAGQVLAELDPAALQRASASANAALVAARARERRARVDLSAAQKGLDRATNLADRAVASAARLEAAQAEAAARQADLRVASAQRTQAQAELERIALDVERSKIVSPMAGTITTRHLEPGGWAQVGAPAFRIAASDPLRVRFDLPEQDAGLVAVGDAVGVHVSGGESHEARVMGVAGEVDRARRAVAVEGLLDKAPGGWIPGMFVQVRVQRRAARDGLIVPASAVLGRLGDGAQEQKGIFLAADGKALWRPVRVVAKSTDGLAAVAGDLAEGDDVIVSGHIDLSDGAAILVGKEARP